MSLDPVLAQLIEALPKIEPGPVDWPALRKASSSLAKEILGPEGMPTVDSVENRSITSPGGDVRIRIFRPKQPTSTTMLFIHGGGWAVGDLDMVEHTARRICRDLPAVVVACTYRLAPEHPFPAAFEDALIAAQWVQENVSALGGDKHLVVIGGDSAGGNLAAAVCQSLGTSVGEHPAIAAQLLLYPAVDLRPSATYPSRAADADPTLRAFALDQCFEAYFQSPEHAFDVRASPLASDDLSGLPPTLTVVLTVDPLRDEAMAYALRLRDAGVRSELLEFEHLTHGFVHMAGIVPAAATAFEAVLERLGTMLRREHTAE